MVAAPHLFCSRGQEVIVEMTNEDRRASSRAMECYSGMVECMDVHIGRVLDYIESSGDMDSQSNAIFWKGSYD